MNTVVYLLQLGSAGSGLEARPYLLGRISMGRTTLTLAALRENATLLFPLRTQRSDTGLYRLLTRGSHFM